MSCFYISAAHKSSGKTTLAIGLAAAIHQRGLSIQTFKKGPDYIDPIWLAQASGSDCYNLDFFTASKNFNVQRFQQFSQNKDVVLVEGNMGLFDGISLDGSDSNAAMAKLLNLPVILVVDCFGTSSGIAPLLLGYQHFDTEIQYAGVILNRVAGSRHESKLRRVIETYTDFKILGAIHRNKDIQLTERHLGLMPSNEMSDQSDAVIQRLADEISKSINIDALLQLPNSPILNDVEEYKPPILPQPTIRVAYAKDDAFGFYYPGDLERFKQLGVEMIAFDTSESDSLPSDIDGLFIGGGFPESRLQSISANHLLCESIKNAIQDNLPTYAECGGLMYLCSEMRQEEENYPLCNVIPAKVEMNRRPQGRGYVILQKTARHPWASDGHDDKEQIKAHEFHYSSLSGLPENLNYAYSIERGTGIDGLNDGIVLYNLLASYVHLRQTDECSWVDNFVSFVKKCKSTKDL